MLGMDKVILSDFDGTITTQDTLARILDRFAERDWRPIEKRVRSEEFGNRIGLRQEFNLCDPKKATREAIVRLLNEEIEIDPYFKPFLEFCGREGFKFIIVSGGFSLCIETMLKKYNLENLEYYANKLLFEKDRLRIEYPYSAEDCKECGNCKTMHLGRFHAFIPQRNARGFTFSIGIGIGSVSLLEDSVGEGAYDGVIPSSFFHAHIAFFFRSSFPRRV